MNAEIYLKILKAAGALMPEAILLLQNLVRIPSINRPPYGDEKAVQEFYNDWLQRHGVDSKITCPSEIPAFATHPARLPEHDMRERPNVTALLKGSGTGRSLLVLAHADTEIVGEMAQWRDDPFSGIERDGRIYGRGAGDDKSGMAIAAILPLVLRKAGLKLGGDLVVASVADEEQGGANGAAALLASGIQADAAVYLDGTNDQAIWHAGLGCGIVEVIMSASLPESLPTALASAQKIIVAEKEKIKQSIVKHPAFGRSFFDDIMQHFFNINLVFPDNHQVKLRFVMDTLPGDDEDLMKKQLEEKLHALSCPEVTITIAWMSRFLKPALLPLSHPLVVELSRAFEIASGRHALVSPGCQSDQGIINHYGGIPCVLFGCGRRGRDGASHLPNEYILLKEFKENLLTTAIFAVNWCGAE